MHRHNINFRIACTNKKYKQYYNHHKIMVWDFSKQKCMMKMSKTAQLLHLKHNFLKYANNGRPRQMLKFGSKLCTISY